MCFPTVYRLILIQIALALVVGCSSSIGPDPGTAGQWQEAGLSEMQIHSIQSEDGILFAGTDRGVFLKKTDSSDEEWLQSGLDIDSSEVVDFVIWNTEDLLAAVKYDEVRTDKPTLFRSTDGGSTWKSIEINKPDELNYFVVRHLVQQSENPKNIIAYVGRIIRSGDGGNTWKIIYNNGYSEFLTIDENHPDYIWTGGQNNTFGPALAKSEDGGETWTKLNQEIFNGAEVPVLDALPHLGDPGRVLVAMIFIRRTSDGGQSWEDVLARDIAAMSLTHSARHPGVVYAGGINEERQVAFAQSTDFGDSWEIVPFEDGPGDMWVNDIIAVEENSREVLYLATDRGVFSYRFKE